MRKSLLVLFFSFALLVITACQGGYSGESAEQKTSPKVSDVDFSVDKGETPWVFDIEAATLANESYRSVNWTGKNLQFVFMSLKPGETIDLEMHSEIDQFIRIEGGEALVEMGKTVEELTFREEVEDDWAILIPAGYWHRVENIGSGDLKLYTLYGPAEHAFGTIQRTYEEAVEAHDDHHHGEDHEHE